MAKHTLYTIPLHALHSHSTALLTMWYGLFVTAEELSAARQRRPLRRYYVIVEIAPGRIRVAAILPTIAQARGAVATHAPFARVATLRHDAADHDDWPGAERDIAVDDQLPATMFDWTR
ncbi:MAG: hypothetical protein MJE77_19245 [Proteobacteria bacterium]|nr:hypothetical protein [Pseudomonadota bacterium]